MPSGLAAAEASLASRRLGAAPTETVSPSWRLTARQDRTAREAKSEPPRTDASMHQAGGSATQQAAYTCSQHRARRTCRLDFVCPLQRHLRSGCPSCIAAAAQPKHIRWISRRQEDEGLIDAGFLNHGRPGQRLEQLHATVGRGVQRASLEPQPGAPMAAGAKLQKGGTQTARRRQDMSGSPAHSPIDSLKELVRSRPHAVTHLHHAGRGLSVGLVRDTPARRTVHMRYSTAHGSQQATRLRLPGTNWQCVNVPWQTQEPTEAVGTSSLQWETQVAVGTRNPRKSLPQSTQTIQGGTTLAPSLNSPQLGSCVL